MFLAEIWRYPVKSMGGETLEECQLTELGLAGDRIVHVEDARGRVQTARSKPRLLLHRSTLGESGLPLVDGRHFTDPEVAREVEAAAGEGARLVRYEGPERFDILPLLVATDGAIASLGIDLLGQAPRHSLGAAASPRLADGRRFRPNLIIGGVEGLEERNWEGRLLEVGTTQVRAVSLRQRCVMTTFDPDTAAQDRNVLRRVQQELDGSFALDAEVVRPGRIHVGDPVRLIQ